MVTLQFRKMSTLPLMRSFIMAMDLKTGSSIVTLFALINKVAGIYGLVAVLSGGADVAQLTMYLYSVATIFVFIWGMRKISEEDGSKTLVYGHLFAFDHLVSTVYTAWFGVVWYAFTPHDGRRVANSDAQKEMLGDVVMDDATRIRAAEAIWKSERGFSAAVLVLGWLIKVYFILCLYSYALHLRRGTYRTLPMSRTSSPRLVRRHSAAMRNGGYQHLRTTSIMTDDTTNATLAETLWETNEEDGLSTKVENSPDLAKGTGMTRSKSGDSATMGKQRAQSVSSDNAPATNAFSRILGRLSSEASR